MNNMSEFFAPLDDKRKKEMAKTFFNSSPNDPKTAYEVSRHDILKDLLNLYCTHYRITKAESLDLMITNSIINNNFFPVCLAKAIFEYLVFGDVRNSTLIERFKLYLQSNERSILEKVLKGINVCDFDWQILWDALIDAGTSSKSNFMEIVLKTAKHVFYEKPCFLVTHVKKRLSEFWEDISKDVIDAL